MSCVGIVLVSHSAELAEGLKKLLNQVQPHVPIAAAGGGNEGEIGTSIEKITAAIESVRSEKGVAVFFGARFAVEVVDEHRLPVATAEAEHQRDLVAVPGLTDAIQTVFAHGRITVMGVGSATVRAAGALRKSTIANVGLFLQDAWSASR